MTTKITVPRKYILRIDEELEYPIPCQQGDMRSRKISFYLEYQNKPFDLSDVRSVECFGIKADNKKIYNTAIIEDVTGGVVRVELTEEILQVYGDISMQLTLKGFDGEVLSTCIFILRVKKTLRNEGIESMETTDILERLVDYLQKVITDCETTFALNEHERGETFIANEEERQNVFLQSQQDRENTFSNSMSDFDNRYNQMTIAKQQDLEVIDARTSTVKSKTFPTLVKRLEESESDTKTIQSNVSNHLSKIQSLESRATSLEEANNLQGEEIDNLSSLIDNIINGSQGIGNADTLDGHDSTYFVPAESFSQLLNGNLQAGDSAKLGGKLPSEYSEKTHTHLWDEIEGVPSALPPAEHSHEWLDILNKPETFKPEAHEHENYSRTGHGHSWSDISGKPSNFTPSAHTHSGSSVGRHFGSGNPSNSLGVNGDVYFKV